MKKVREVLNAREGVVYVEKVRKARNKKLIIKYRAVVTREKVKERIRKSKNT